MRTDDAVDIRLTRETLDVGAAVARVTCAAAGGIAAFVGTTREETHVELEELQALEYHAYEEMALAEIRKLVRQASEKWHATRIVVWHRLGSVAVGEASVVIAVSCVHRAEAFDACRYLIDSLKETVPIWKKEVYGKKSRWQGQ